MSDRFPPVIADPISCQEMDVRMERDWFIAAIPEGDKDIRESRTRPAAKDFAELRAQHGLRNIPNREGLISIDE